MDGLGPDCSKATKDHLLVKHPCSCTTYFVCLTDPPIPMECPSGLKFNESLQTCDYAINVNCKEGCPTKPNIMEKIEKYEVLGHNDVAMAYYFIDKLIETNVGAYRSGTRRVMSLYL
ncbi:unnamed protein product [Heterotrigona itama]|uniref:Chitin-binding type-2 domain-containing protein n=1 Tax=Heterotrigona itama TaxID=395501 RepID=A0A6V7HC58_9HYME|nr:unnamed protein product [Heterotrigona itama]